MPAAETQRDALLDEARTYPVHLADFLSHPRWREIKLAEVRAVRIESVRPPRKGEWYLSGAIPEAYQAKADLDYPRQILRLVRVQKVTQYRVLEQL